MAKEYYAQIGDVIEFPKREGKWVVEKAEMTGGGYAMFNDYYPDAWHVTARRLNDDGSYNPKRRTVRFTQNTVCYNTVIKGVKKVGKLKKVVNFV